MLSVAQLGAKMAKMEDSMEKLKATISCQFLCLCPVAREKLIYLIYDRKACERTESRGCMRNEKEMGIQNIY